jgi:hypothetical protein
MVNRNTQIAAAAGHLIVEEGGPRAWICILSPSARPAQATNYLPWVFMLSSLVFSGDMDASNGEMYHIAHVYKML